MKKKNVTKLVMISAIIIGLAVLLAVQSDLAYNVAQQRHILLGRYTVERTITLLVVTTIAAFVIRDILKKKRQKTVQQKKEDTFKVIALTFSILIVVIFFDIALRISASGFYVKEGASYHRQPNSRYEGTFIDKPEALFSYPKHAPGYKAVNYTLTVDGFGFRNKDPNARADWIILGDSFAEGSGISDEEIWPALLAKNKKVSIYNLGMSGGSPLTYLETLKKFGLQKEPNAVIYLLYEGNDFRDGNFVRRKLDNPKKETLSDIIFKGSPLRRIIKNSIIRFLSPPGRERFHNNPGINNSDHIMYPVAWLPLEVPENSGNYYTFDIKRLLQHFYTAQKFEVSLAYKEIKRLLLETKKLCNESDIRLIVVYAPDKPHILIDEIVSRVSAEQLAAFVALKQKDLPAAGQLKQMLRSRMTVQYDAFQKFCSENDIGFISLVETLKQTSLRGSQTYFTYDQHWTPEGHKVVAECLAKSIQTEPHNQKQ